MKNFPRLLLVGVLGLFASQASASRDDDAILFPIRPENGDGRYVADQQVKNETLQGATDENKTPEVFPSQEDLSANITSRPERTKTPESFSDFDETARSFPSWILSPSYTSIFKTASNCIACDAMQGPGISLSFGAKDERNYTGLGGMVGYRSLANGSGNKVSELILGIDSIAYLGMSPGKIGGWHFRGILGGIYQRASIEIRKNSPINRDSHAEGAETPNGLHGESSEQIAGEIRADRIEPKSSLVSNATGVNGMSANHTSFGGISRIGLGYEWPFRERFSGSAIFSFEYSRLGNEGRRAVIVETAFAF